MEENEPKTGKFALRYGLILGGASVAFGLMLYSMDMHYQGGTMVFTVTTILMLAAIIIGMLQFKKANNGFMSLKEGFKIGVGICLVGGIIGVIYNLLLTNVIDPDFFTKFNEFQANAFIESGMKPEEAEASIEMQKNFQNSGMQVLFGLISSIIFGFLLSLIPAFVIKKQETI